MNVQVWRCDGKPPATSKLPEFIGRVAIASEDWLNAGGNWRHAALAAAQRVYGPGIYHVSESGPVYDR